MTFLKNGQIFPRISRVFDFFEKTLKKRVFLIPFIIFGQKRVREKSSNGTFDDFFSSPCVMYARHCFQSVILVYVHIRPVRGTVWAIPNFRISMYVRVTSVIPVFATSCNMYIHYLPIWHGLKITYFMTCA